MPYILLVAYRSLAATVVVILVGLALASPLILIRAYAADTWYVGQGAKQNMYVTYQTQEFQTNNGRPFNITIYFKDQDSSGKWNAPTFVVDQGKVLKGNLTLGANLAPLSGSQTSVPSTMNPYVNAYSLSLTWIQGNSPQAQPKSLSAITWGGLGGIGTSPLNREGTETLNVGGKTYDTTVFVSHKGQSDSKFWINKDFPYPIQAILYADTTNGGLPVTQFKFQLITTGTGEPTPPPPNIKAPTPPLTATTPSGNYKIILGWTPQDIKPGVNETFSLRFTDSRDKPLSTVSYNLVAMDSNGKAIKELDNQLSDASGAASNSLAFSDSGPAKISVTINSVSNLDTGIIIEKSDFDIVVVPEFPLAALFVAGAVVGLVVLLTRTNLVNGWLAK